MTSSRTTSHRIRGLALAAALGLSAVALTGTATSAERPDDALAIYRVHVDDAADVARLVAGYDVLESRGADFLRVLGERDVAETLRAAGFRVTAERELPPLPGVPGRRADGTIDAAALDSSRAGSDGHDHTASSTDAAILASTYYGGYRTVDEHMAHLDAVAAAHPELATVVDYGDSWRAVNGLAGANDLRAICLTRIQAGDCALSPDAPKPRAMVMAAIHARELQTSELAWRLIDELVAGYGTDPDITLILDTTEVWVIPVVNPDGREIVESGGNSPYLQRKNANDSLGNCAVPPTSSNQHGVDLNRNADFQWGGIGTSTNPCAQTYRGTNPASEPEQQALESFFRSLWPDANGTNDGGQVPATTTGSFISLHSYGELVLLPPGDAGTTLNDAELRAFAFRMSHFNGYVTGTGPEILYGVTGSTDDFTYGRLGVASFTYEVSPSSGGCGGFTPPYSCIDGGLWQRNRDALLYSLKVAGAPYVTPLGPTTTSVDASQIVTAGAPVAVSAVVDDDALGTASGSVGRPAPAAVIAAEYFVDVAPGAPGTGVPMAFADGGFGETTETVTASIDTTTLELGRHTVHVRGRSQRGWGPITSVTFTVEEGSPSSSVASAQTTVAGTVTGALAATHAADGVVQTIVEAESGGRPDRRFDSAEHRYTLPAAGGNQTLRIIASATDAGDADDGFAIEWSTDGSAWVPVAVVSAASPVDGAFDIGAPTGNVFVRVVDTDRTAGQRSPDSVSIDLLRRDGDGEPVDPGDPTVAVASIVTSTQGAGRGVSNGVAVVTVLDDQGGFVSGASVTVEFSGDLAETRSGTTGSDGTVTLVTASAARKPVFSACVASLSAPGLTYEPGTEACSP